MPCTQSSSVLYMAPKHWQEWLLCLICLLPSFSLFPFPITTFSFSLLPPSREIFLSCCFPFAVICPSAASGGPDNTSTIFYSNDTELQQFEMWWNKSKTVPFYLIGLLLPLLNFKSPSFFAKFNILGKPTHLLWKLQ